jgi:ElaB/YqjD/DUF883 family membrane-anchored ribosome-binding protein
VFDAEAQRPDGAEVVAIMTPNDSHYAFAMQALERGLDVICDKPMTNTLEEAEAYAAHPVLGVRLRDTKERLIDLEVALVDKTKACARATDDFVHEEPWKAVGVAAALGLALGVLIGRR